MRIRQAMSFMLATIMVVALAIPAYATDPITGEVNIEESQITRAISTKEIGISSIKYIHPKAECDINHPCTFNGCVSRSRTDYCPDRTQCKDGGACKGHVTYWTERCEGHRCEPITITKANFKHFFERDGALDKTIEGWTSVFEPTTLPSIGYVEGERKDINKYEFTTKDYDYASVIHRVSSGRPTLAGYTDNTNRFMFNSSFLVSAMDLSTANISSKARLNVAAKETTEFSINLIDKSPDAITKAKHEDVEVKGRMYVRSDEIELTGAVMLDENEKNIAKYNLTAVIKSYTGDSQNQRLGNDTLKGRQTIPLLIEGQVSRGASGQMTVLSPLKFNPYVRMTWQPTLAANADRMNAAVLSEYISTIAPNAYAEAGWYQAKGGEDTVNVSSTEWTTDPKAVQGNENWKGNNQVIEADKTYQVDTNGAGLKVQISTWQPVIADQDLVKAMQEAGTNVADFTLAKAKQEYESYRDEAVAVLNRYRLVMWVDGKWGAKNAWDSGTKIDSTEADLTYIRTGKILRETERQTMKLLSNDPKYWLSPDSAGGTSDKTNEGDIDTANRTEDVTYYKVYSNVRGEVFVVSTKSASTIANATGGFMVADRADTELRKLPTDLMELNSKTMIITNYIKAIERNGGNDSSDPYNLSMGGKWYNEAWPGIVVEHRTCTWDVGLFSPTIRAAQIDPQLVPQNDNGLTGLYNTAYLAGFRLNNKPEGHSDKEDGYIGSFRGSSIVLPEVENMLQSKRFFITN